MRKRDVRSMFGLLPFIRACNVIICARKPLLDSHTSSGTFCVDHCYTADWQTHWLWFVLRVTACRYLECCGSAKMDSRSHRMPECCRQRFDSWYLHTVPMRTWRSLCSFLSHKTTHKVRYCWRSFSSSFTFRLVFVLQYFWTRTLLSVEFYAS